jgi:zinc and cadmium transporter
MSTLGWIVAGGVAMGVLSLVGAVTLLLDETTQRRLIRPLVAFAAGSLLGGAMVHMIPEATARTSGISPYVAVLAGFALFLAIEQFLHWHHCHRETADCRPPLGYLILAGDGLHNLLGGLAVGAAFVADIGVGLTIWLAAAAHEVPQELGDFGVLIHGGWSRTRALAFNLLSSATFLVGGVVAWAASARFDTSWLLGFAAGNFLYIGASDLVPEVNRHRELSTSALHFAAFVAGAGMLVALKAVLGD